MRSPRRRDVVGEGRRNFENARRRGIYITPLPMRSEAITFVIAARILNGVIQHVL